MMRQEHPDQQELPELPPGGPPEGSADLAEMSEVAALTAEALDLALVREHRPVFVYDRKMAKAKKGNAARQARHRERLAQRGLVMLQVPRDIAEAVKAAGSWDAVVNAASAPPLPAPPLPVNELEQQLGAKVRQLKGWRASLVAWLLK